MLGLHGRNLYNYSVACRFTSSLPVAARMALVIALKVANGLHEVQQGDKRAIAGAACGEGEWTYVVPAVPWPTSAGSGTRPASRWRTARALPRRRSGRLCPPR